MSESAPRTLPAPSPRALKILFGAFWGPQGWTRRPPAPDDLAYATSEGVMFPPAAITHDELVDDAKCLAGEVDERAASDAFLASLTSRRVDLRSALGSLHVARALPEHRFVLWPGERVCAVCGRFASAGRTHDLNVLSFERFKWGGVRRLDPLYLAFDLARFNELDPVEPSPEDLEVARAIIGALENAAQDPKATPGALAGALKGVFPSNDPERRILLEILAVCGIVQPRAITPLRDRWTDYRDHPPPGRGPDWKFPVYAWRGSDGLDEAAAAAVFPQLSG